METVQNLVYKYSTGKIILVLFVVTQVVYFVMLGYTIPQVTEYTDGMEIFDLSPQGYNVEYAQTLLGTLGEDGRHTYLVRQIPMDFIYPGLFIVTYTLLLSYIFKRGFSENSFMQQLVFVPMLAGIFDYLENVGIILMLNAYPDFSSTVVQTSSMFTIAKSLLTVLFFVLLFVGLAKWLFKFVRRDSL